MKIVVFAEALDRLIWTCNFQERQYCMGMSASHGKIVNITNEKYLNL